MPTVSEVVTKMPLETTLVLAACGKARGIGKNGTLPWPKLAGDLKRFKELTLGHAVLMGSATYLGLPESVRPLPGRLNIVLSTRSRQSLGLPDTVLLAGSLDAAATILEARSLKRVFIIGGEKVFKQALEEPAWSQRVFYSHIDKEFECDRFFPINLDDPASGFQVMSVGAKKNESNIAYQWREYVRGDSSNFFDAARVSTSADERVEHPEYQYLNLVKRILLDGVSRGDRTGTGTLSLFGAQIRFDLQSSFPLLTTKRVFWRGVVEELLWFISGSTNANELAAKRVHIWDGNGSRQFLDKLGFTSRKVGDLGPVYGFQWRHFGAQYEDMSADYNGCGIDQLANVIDTIKRNPNDRRIILCAWNPTAMPLMALPPCHVLAQFYVANGRLSCQMYQRSCDMGLGVPFNIASYALLTCLVADVCGLDRGDFVHTLGDAHVYKNHVDALKLQLQRKPRPFPTLTIKHRDSIDEFTAEDIVLQGYDPHNVISMKMAV